MYLSANNRDTSTSILSIKEIIGIVLVFAFMLYLLFPKDDIDSILEGNGKNKNLSINYLESMLLYYPKSIKLQMTLIRNYREGGKPQKALKLTRKLLNEVESKTTLSELYRLEYQLLKKAYFEEQTEAKLKTIKEKLWHYFNFREEEKDYTFFFAEATQLDMPKLKFMALKKVMLQRPELITYDFEKGFFHLATYLKQEEDSYNSLLKLLNYPEVDNEIKLYAISYLFSHKEYSYAEDIAHELFVDAKNDKKIREYFEIVLTLFTQNPSVDIKQVSSLIQEYQARVQLTNNDIEHILKTLIAMGNTPTSAHFGIEFFNTYPEIFKERTCELAVNALVYNQQLEDALDIAYFAKEKYPSMKWLDKTIQLSLWSGKMRKVMALNAEGFNRYADPKYKTYLEKIGTFNTAYKILGEIAKKSLANGDMSMVKQMADYFEYTGEIPEGEAYFTKLYTTQAHKEILKEAILFTYMNTHFKKGLNLYTSYREQYGMERELQRKSIDALTALKHHHEAYLFTKALKEESKAVLDMAQIDKDYPHLYQILWSLEKKKKLPAYRYATLISLEKELNKGKKLAYLYAQGWKQGKRSNYLYALLYNELKDKKFNAITETLQSIKNKKYFEKEVPYHIFMANFYAKTNKKSQALKSFQKALALNEHDASTHQAYLWFLLDTHETKALKREISLLRKQKTLQKSIGFASVVGALQLQKSDLALRWLKPILKNSNNIEYQIVLADILELQDRVEGANKIRMQLFNQLNQQIKKEPKLLEKKEFARLYLQLSIRYKTPFGKRKALLKKLKKIFSPEEYHELEVGYYTFTQSNEQVKYLASKYNMNIPWLNFYLAMSKNDNQAKAKLLQTEGDTLAIRDRVKASLDIGDRAGAYSLAFQGMKENQNDVELYRLYNDMVSQDYPNGLLKTEFKQLSKDLTLKEQQLSYRWLMASKYSINLSLSHYDYSNKQADILALRVKQKTPQLSWEASLEKHFKETTFMGASVKANYNFKNIATGVEAHYQTKTTQTPLLQSQGIENSLLLNLNSMLTQRIQLGFNHKFSQYKLTENKLKIGSAQESQLSLSYLLRSGYPDIRFNSYLTKHHYSITKEGYLPKDFSELGTQLSIGETGTHRLHQSWRPFGSFGLAINNHHELGTSLSVGVSSSIRGADSLRLMLDYSKGVDMISQPSYGVHLEYKF